MKSTTGSVINLTNVVWIMASTNGTYRPQNTVTASEL
jgi:hypothetical protein